MKIRYGKLLVVKLGIIRGHR